MPSPFLQGKFAPVCAEVSASNLPVVFGSIPAELAGAYIRNGPNLAVTPRSGHHWFEGDGMLHMVTFGSAASTEYRNRFVRSETYLYGQAYGVKHNKRYFHSIFMDFRGWWALISFLCWQLLGVIKVKLHLQWLFPMNPWVAKDLANTSVVYHANKLLALVESGPPTIIAVPTLATIGVESFDRKLTHPFTAHPKKCPLTGELVFFGYNVEPPHCILSSLSPSGTKTQAFTSDSTHQ